MRTWLDTNVLVGLALGASDPERFVASREALEDLVGQGRVPTVAECVLCETAWVLESRYGVPRPVAAGRLFSLLDAEDLDAWDEPLALGALALQAEEPTLDIADCLLTVRSAPVDDEVLTFDRRLGRAIRDIEIVDI